MEIDSKHENEGYLVVPSRRVGVKTREGVSVKGIALRVSITNPLCSTSRTTGQVERVCMCVYVHDCSCFCFKKTKRESLNMSVKITDVTATL